MNPEALIEASDRAGLECSYALGVDLAEQAMSHPFASPLQQAQARALIELHALRSGERERALREGE